MDKREKAVRRAKDAIVFCLVTVAQHKTEQEAIEAMHELEAMPYADLLEEKSKVLALKPWANRSMVWFMDLCIAEVAQTEPKQRKQLAEVY